MSFPQTRESLFCLIGSLKNNGDSRFRGNDPVAKAQKVQSDSIANGWARQTSEELMVRLSNHEAG
jgi:hypothetical protein